MCFFPFWKCECCKSSQKEVGEPSSTCRQTRRTFLIARVCCKHTSSLKSSVLMLGPTEVTGSKLLCWHRRLLGRCWQGTSCRHPWSSVASTAEKRIVPSRVRTLSPAVPLQSDRAREQTTASILASTKGVDTSCSSSSETSDSGQLGRVQWIPPRMLPAGNFFQ